jgi:DNA-binding transcriptional ArsR family regulator
MGNAADSEANRSNDPEQAAAIDARLAKALSHPTRAQILARLSEKEASPKELSDTIGEELPKVSYHCRKLLELKCIEVARIDHVRGARKTTYRGTMRMLLGDAVSKQLSRETRVGLSIAAFEEVVDRVKAAIEAGTFDRRHDRNLITMTMNLDSEGWSAVSEIVIDAYRRLTAVEAEAANRHPKSSEEIRTTVSLLSYESP